jgi:pimeloyl-ACP methyl ester carboxylesterase
VIAAARSPQAIRSLTLIAPFVRDIMPPWVTAAIFGPLLGGPWRAALWRAYFKRAFPTHVPADYDAEAARRDASLAEAGRFAAFRRMALASKAESEASVAGVRAPALVLMGSRDIDFSKPYEEATFVAELLGGRATMIDGAGHYPQAEFPDEVAAQIVPFLQSVDVRSKTVCFAP